MSGFTAPEYVVDLSWPAQQDIEQRLAYGTGLEVAGGMLGRVCGYRIDVDRIIPNRCGPFEDDHTPVDLAYFATFERSYVPGRPDDEVRLVGTVHSHEIESGPANPFESDLDHLVRLSQIPHQLAYCGLILSPAGGELYEAGEPTGRFDWSDGPIMRAWVAAAGGEIWVARVVLQSERIANLESRVKFQPRRSYAA